MHIYVKVPGKVVMNKPVFTMNYRRLQINWMVSIPPACIIAVYFLIKQDFFCYNSLQEMSLAHSPPLITTISLLAMLDFNKVRK